MAYTRLSDNGLQPIVIDFPKARLLLSESPKAFEEKPACNFQKQAGF
ncbi:MAG: hypothetical protein LBM07_00545 [Culturomica sp.]|jgi:hypothetical protein|nr:hypothetical protein [Culturomica sp.]